MTGECGRRWFEEREGSDREDDSFSSLKESPPTSDPQSRPSVLEVSSCLLKGATTLPRRWWATAADLAVLNVLTYDFPQNDIYSIKMYPKTFELGRVFRLLF